jgi:outer membrane protein assembly factor BamD (BamD/ComL family)
MRTRFRTAAWVIVVLAFPASLYSQASNDIAKRTLDSGMAFYQRGDYKQALQDFQTVIGSFQNSEWVDEALLQVAKYYYEVEKNLEKCRENLQRIQRELATSNSTPEAYYYLGYILSDSAVDVEQLRDGLANFERVARLFPDSDFADDALFQAGRVHTALKEYDAALEKLQMILLEYMDSNLRIESQFAIAENYMFKENMLQAMVEYQKVRNNYPAAPLADKALDRLTLLYRIYFSSQAGIPPYRKDTSFSVRLGQTLDDPVYIEYQDGAFYLADRGLDRVFKFDTAGALLESSSVRRPGMVKAASRDDVTVLAERQLRGKTAITLVDKSDERGEQMTSIEAFCRGPRGQYYVWDRRANFIQSYRTDLTPDRVYRGNEYRDVRDMAVDRFGNLYVLDGKERRIVVYDPNGVRLKTIGPTVAGVELRDPKFIEVDEANNLYVLDRRNESVLVLGPDGNRLATLAFGDAVKDPRGLAVDSCGAILLADRKLRSVIRYH